MNTILSMPPEHSVAIQPSVSIGSPANPAARRLAWVATGAAIVLAASLPWWGESSWMREFVEIACYLIFAMMWNLLAGYGGT
jgi:branched-chain amino acid transport system permease protein